MAKSKGRLLAELLASDGKVKESKSALDISGGKLAPSDIPTLPNSKLENSSISIAGHSTSLGGSVTLNTGDISEHTNYKYYTEARVRAAISASGDLSYNSSTGVISFSASASPVISVNSATGSVVLDTGDIAENGNLYHTTARARSAISATGSLSYNSTTGVMSFTMPAQNTSNITEGSNLYHTTARARAAISASGNAISYNSSTGVISSTFEESPTFTGHVSVQGNLNVGNSSAGNLMLKRPSANYIWADQTSGYFIFGTNGRGTSYANRAMALTADNDANFGRDVNVVRQVSAPIYYDSNNTAYYVNPATGSILNNLDMRGSSTMLPAHAYSNTHDGTNVYWHVGSAAGSTNKVLNLRVYKSDNTNYTIHKFTTAGLEVGGTISSAAITSTGASSIGSGTLHVNATENRVGINTNSHIGTVLNILDVDDEDATLRLHTNTNSHKPVLRMNAKNSSGTQSYADIKYNPDSPSLNFHVPYNETTPTLKISDSLITVDGTLTVNSTVSGIGDIDFGKAIPGHNTSSPARITASSTGQLYIDSTQNQHLYLGWYNNAGYDILSEMNARFASYKDRSDTAYYVNPAGASNIRNLVIKGTTSDSSTDGLTVKDSSSLDLFRVRNDGVVLVSDNYFYVNSSQGAYFDGTVRARNGITDDTGQLSINSSTGDITFNSADFKNVGATEMSGQLSFTSNNTAIRMRDSAGAYTRTMILNGSNTMYIGPVDTYAGGSILYGASSNVSGQTFNVGGNTKLAVTGSGITVTGTITGDITGSLSGTATQASNLNNHNTGNLSEGSNLYYTDARVGTYLSNNGYATQSTIVAAITDSAPTTLDTLNELAAALGDDANFSTTVTNSIATKAPLANPSLTGNTSIAGNLVMSNSTSEIRLGSYLKLHGATGSNTATLSVNATYDGAQTDSWTPGYSGDVNAGMFMLRQFSGGSGTMQVYQKKHGTTSSSTGRGTFTKTAEFNHDGYFYGRNLRSERYYSSDNTAYYTDPSETSVVNKFMVNGGSNNSGKADFAVGTGGNPQVSWNGSQVQIGGTDMNWNGKINYGSNIFSMAAWDAQIDFFIQGGTTSRNIVFKPSNAGTATERLTIHGDNGAVIASSQMRAPIFYDSDNTNYYSNPGSTSVFNALTLSTLNATTLNVSGNTQLGNGSGDITHINDIVHIGATDSGDSDLYFGEGGTNNIRYGVHWDWDSGYRFTWNTRNNGTDSTLFYYDTNSTSYIHWGRSHHIANNDINYVNQLHFNDDVRFLDEGNSSYLRYKSGHTTTGGIKYYNGSDALQGYVYFDTAGFGLLSADGSWGVRTWNSGTHIYHATRSPVYYDSDDTTYYVDPNHTTTSAKFAGNVQHTGLTMTSGSDVDQLYTVTVSAQLTTSWQDTGINGTDLSTGTYIVQIYADSDVPRYHYQEYYSGVMSWYNGGTNSNEVDEITLHRAGHAPNDGNIFLRTLRHPSGGDNLMLQLRATHNSTSASNYIFKFRRMI